MDAYTLPTAIARNSAGSLQDCAERKSPGVEHLDMLEQELDRAEVVASEAIPRDVVTMNSEVRMQDMDSGSIQRYKLVFPNQFRWDFWFRCSLQSVPPCLVIVWVM